MNRIDPHPTRAAAALILAIALAASTSLLAQGADEQWEITSKMEMPGMTMPAQILKHCVGKNAKDEEFVPKQGNCKMVDSKRTGNKFTYKMTCTGNEPSTTEGEVVFGTGAYEGKMRMTMTKTNDSMQMTYSAKRIGSCTAPK